MNDETQCLMKNGSFSFDGYQVVRSELLSQTNMPVICFDGIRLSVNAACLRKMPDVNYIQFLVNPSEQKLILRPCGEDDRDSFRWCNIKNNKRTPRKIICRMFTAKLADLMGWSMDKSYRIMGTVFKTDSEYLMLFDLKSAEAFWRMIKQGETKSTLRKNFFPEEWRDCFGLTIKEHEKSIKVNLFDDYTVFRLNG